MTTQDYYDNFIKNWGRKATPSLYTYQRILFSVSETQNGKDWFYLATAFLSEEDAREVAQLESKGSNNLWRVATGSHTLALFLNGEEIKDNG